MMKKALIFTLTVLVVLLAGCGVMPADEKESATQSQTVSFPAGNETVSEQEPTEAEKETEVPVQTEEEPSSKASELEIEETPQPTGQPKKETPKSKTPQSQAQKAETTQTEPKPTQQPAETKPVQEETVSQPPKEPEPEPTAPPEPAKPKSIYDYEFDVEAIRQELLGIGTGMGLTIDSSLTPDSASWGNPVTASKDFHGNELRAQPERLCPLNARPYHGIWRQSNSILHNLCGKSRRRQLPLLLPLLIVKHTTLCFNRQRVFFLPKNMKGRYLTDEKQFKIQEDYRRVPVCSPLPRRFADVCFCIYGRTGENL